LIDTTAHELDNIVLCVLGLLWSGATIFETVHDRHIYSGRLIGRGM